MKYVKVGASSLNQTPLDWDGNTRRILCAIEAAKERNISILCLPELCITGWGCEDLFLAPHVLEHSWNILHDEIAPATQGIIVAVGLPIWYQNCCYNAAALLVDGVIAGFTIKQFLAGDGVHYESRWFKAWPAGIVTTLMHESQTYPIGDIHFLVGDIRIGFEICEDAWVAQRPGANLAFQGSDIILNPSASHFARKKYKTRKRFVEEGSRAFSVTYVYSNLVGNEGGNVVYDGGCLIAYEGSLIAAEERFSYKEFNLIEAVVDVEYSRSSRNQVSSYRPIVDSIHTDCICIPFEYKHESPTLTKEVEIPVWESSPHIQYEEFCRAVSLGLYDYLRKSWSNGFTLSLSGGADSACVATLVRTMVHLAVRGMGKSEFIRSLSYIKSLRTLGETFVDDLSESQIMSSLLTCVYQATDNSSDITRTAAKQIAKAVHATYHEINVQSIVSEYTKVVGKATNITFDWEHHDLLLQNIQARTRAPSIWMFANLENKILLATSNRSEAAVGYATMDGDTAGGLSPIAGVDKSFIRKYLSWLETKGVELEKRHSPKKELHVPVTYSPQPLEALNEPIQEYLNHSFFFTIPELSYINAQAPTAELRPMIKAQTDEQDLMPYDLLNVIESLLVMKKLSPKDIFECLKVEFPSISDKQLFIYLERFIKLFTRNQWKRERYATCFMLDSYSLDPKSWFRFPILNSGFAKELEELRQSLKNTIS